MAAKRKVARKVTVTGAEAVTPQPFLFNYGLNYAQGDFHSNSPAAKILNALGKTINSIKK